MTIVLTVIAVVVIFSVLVLIHEYGHFITAKRAGIKVLEFGIGFPPRIFQKKVGETLYTVNALPFGGFVKLYGEDAADPNVIRDPRSFAGKSKWIRAKVVIAGVVMNLLLALGLLTAGYIAGIEPLILSRDDVFANIESGIIRTAPGIYIAKVDAPAAAAGLSENAKIIAINDVPITDLEQLSIFRMAERDVDLSVEVAGTAKTVHVPLGDDRSLGIELKPVNVVPRPIVAALKSGSPAEKAGLRPGDAILAVNGTHIFFPDQLITQLSRASDSITLEIARNGDAQTISFSPPSQDGAPPLPTEGNVVIADVFENSVAARVGIQRGDHVISVDGAAVATPEELQKKIEQAAAGSGSITLSLLRNSNPLEIRAELGEQKRLGIAISVIYDPENILFSTYLGDVITSVLEVGEVSYPPVQAFLQAISETVRLTGLTIAAFGRTLSSLFVDFKVPEDVGGPVRIAVFTHTFVQEGFFALLRFTALLSMSLAVINILPIPALDGGRLLFILVEGVIGRRVSPRFEALVHTVGFFLLIVLILLITYSDVASLL